MILQNKYLFGCHVMWYELEMMEEHVQSCLQMLEGIENPENVTFHFTLNLQEYLEKIDWEYFDGKYLSDVPPEYSLVLNSIVDYFFSQINRTLDVNENVKSEFKTNDDPFYNIADYRRDICYNNCRDYDMILWGETDSLWPKQTLQILDQVHTNMKSESVSKYIINFADRKLWDNSFAPLHPMYKNVQFKDDEDWQFNNESSGKAYMSLERMNEINDIPLEDISLQIYSTPAFDGSCVGFSSDLLKSGVFIPHALLLAGEDTAMGKIAKKIMGNEFVQINVSNILHVHNRRHPKKRVGILNEDNPSGLCSAVKKGQWWVDLENASKFNLDNLFKQNQFIKFEDVIK